ncbi:uncharacterized protein DMAD_13265 [Drosophila madeirensis]|uniref:Uncharacterized protein n=1 Tax=Drosophila madeirensis TaxID=30013 RepID=A0AAU9FK89_DROMD
MLRTKKIQPDPSNKTVTAIQKKWSTEKWHRTVHNRQMQRQAHKLQLRQLPSMPTEMPFRLYGIGSFARGHIHYPK